MMPEQGFWHLPKPKQFEPGLNSQFGRGIAAKVCLDAAPAKVNRANFDHSVYSSVVEINLSAGPWYQPGKLIAGKMADRYDIAVKATLFYKAAGLDLASVNVTCLLSPMLDIKAIQDK
jgi:hypothetical protein